MAAAEIQPAVRPTHVRWQVFGLAFVTSSLLYLHRYVFAVIKPRLAEEWDLTATQLGEIDSGFAICYTLFQFPLSILADILGVHLVLTALIVAWCGGLGLMAWAPSAKLLWYAQATLGTGQSAVYACLSRIARTWFPRATRTTLQGAVGVLAGRLGALGSGLVFSSLLLGILRLQWRTALWIFAAVGIVHAIVFALVFRNSPSRHPRVNAAEARLIDGEESGQSPKAPAPGGPIAALRSMTPRSLFNLGSLCVQNILSTFADNIYSNWVPLFLARVHHLDFKAMGVCWALPLLGGALGGLAGGALNDYFILRSGNRRWSRVGVAFVGKGMAAALILSALLLYDSPYAFCVCLFFVKFFSDWSYATSLGVVTDIGGRATASVFGFGNAVAGIGSIAAPLVFGYTVDHYGWRVVFVTVGAAYVLCALSWLLIDCTIPVVPDHLASASPD